MEQIIQKKKKLTKKQRGFVNDYVIDENGTKAALKNYNVKEKNARTLASQNLTKLNVIEAIETKQISLRDALRKQGIDENRIALKIDELLNAEKKTFRNNVTTGEIEEIGSETDFTAVDKGLKHATNIYGISSEGPKTQLNITYNFLFSKETQERIAIINKEIKDKLINAGKN